MSHRMDILKLVAKCLLVRHLQLQSIGTGRGGNYVNISMVVYTKMIIGVIRCLYYKLIIVRSIHLYSGSILAYLIFSIFFYLNNSNLGSSSYQDVCIMEELFALQTSAPAQVSP